MNERIEKLAEQAGQYAVSDNSSMLFDVWQKRYTEKFAELIVRECARVYWDIDNGETHTEYVEALKKHFGVDE